MTDNNRDLRARRPDAESDGPGLLEAYRIYVLAAAVVVVAGFAAALWFLYSGDGDRIIAEPPLVRAPEGPYRQKPADPGGIEIPDRDKLVYGRSSDAIDDVSLRAGPELPMDRPAPAPEETPETNDKPETTEPEQAEEADTQVTALPQPETAREAVPAQESGAFVVQLGAFGSEAGARQAWDTLKGRHAAVLGALSPDIETVQRTGQNPLYRLRAGPFAARAAADDACAALKAAGQGCFPVSR